MISAYIVTNGGLDPVSSNNYAVAFLSEEEALEHATLMRINIKYNFYVIDVPESVTTVNVLITHLANKKKTVSYVSSQEEVHTIASSYYKQQYDEYLTTQEKTKSWDYEHMKIACNMTFRPDCTILQMSGTPSQNSYVCFANLKLEDLLID
jgi:hypothetical protein